MVAHAADKSASARGGAATPATTPPALDDHLLAAGRRVLERYGVARTTLERIGEESGLSRVTLYRRGITREVILRALADRALDDYRRALWPALTGRGTATARLRRALGALCDAAEGNLELLLALGERIGAAAAADRTADDRGARRAFAEPLERLLRDGAGDGSLLETDAPETATVLLNLVGWTYVHLRAGERWSARRARRATLAIAMRGVAAPPAAGPSEAGS
jgi:AcrR family transcriptional regulator